MADDDLVPVMTSDKVINPDLARFLGAPLGASLAVQIDAARWPVQAVFYDDHTNEVVLHVHTEAHHYLSTGCLHGEHDYCQSSTGAAGNKKPAQCKFCAAPCRCSCHQEAR